MANDSSATCHEPAGKWIAHRTTNDDGDRDEEEDIKWISIESGWGVKWENERTSEQMTVALIENIIIWNSLEICGFACGIPSKVRRLLPDELVSNCVDN